MKNIISYSLWGDTPMYNIGAIRNAEMAPDIFPEFICRFYLGSDVPKETRDELEKHEHVEIIDVDESNDWQGMFWRFWAVDSEDDVDVVVFRDTDSRLSKREYEAVREWYQSGRCLHIMRDHPFHSEPIMGGMWGVRTKPFMELINNQVYIKNKLPIVSSLRTVISDWLKNEYKRTQNNEPDCMDPINFVTKGIDQRFLRGFVYKMMGYNNLLNNNAWIHDSYPQYNSYSGRFDFQRFPGIKETNTGFPTILYENWNGFIGQVFDENDKPNEEYAELIRQRDECIYRDYPKEDS